MQIYWIGLMFLALTAWTMEKSPVSVSTSPAANQPSSLSKMSGLNDASAKLRVEGASFRPFNLYFGPTKSQNAISQEQRKLAIELRKIVERDLRITGGFTISSTLTAAQASNDALMRQSGLEGTATLVVSFDKDNLKVLLAQKNLIDGKFNSQSKTLPVKDLHRLAHWIAKGIYEQFIGKEDLFDSQIAAVKKSKDGSSRIVLCGFDGNQEIALTKGNWPKASPAFSPDGKTIFYTVITGQGQAIVKQAIGSEKFEFLLRKPGINLDLSVAPNNAFMLATLSFENNATIYRLSPTGGVLGRATAGTGLNLSASISPNGDEMIFVSDRGGSPQIYRQSLTDPKMVAKRLTYQGAYNQTPHYSPDGKYMVFTGRDERKNFDIYLLELSSGRVSRITQNQGRNQEPYFSPSGRFVIFISEREGKGADIFIATLNGAHQARLTEFKALGDAYESPIFRPGGGYLVSP